ncbi:MAG: SDR family NAD(P)-dependent oxidoreductase [Lacipirellulaceae bacterium]
MSHAFHSPLMDPVLDEFERFASRFEYAAPTVPIASNVTGRLIKPQDGATFGARYWRDHLRGVVRFADGVAAAGALGVGLWVELGPAPTLVGLAKRSLDGRPATEGSAPNSWLASMRPGQPAGETLAAALAGYYAAGGVVDWRGVQRSRGPLRSTRRAPLPNYPFDRQRYWYDPADTGEGSGRVAATGASSPVLGGRVASPLAAAAFEASLAPERPAWLDAHRVQGSVVTPGSVYVEQALAAAYELRDPESDLPLAVEDVAVQQPMFVGAGSPRRVHTTVGPLASGRRTVEVHSAPLDGSGAWTLHAQSAVIDAPCARPDPIDLDAVRDRALDTMGRDEFYRRIAERGLQYGPAFRVLDDIHRAAHDAVARVAPTADIITESPRYRLHPVLGDALLQGVACTAPTEADGSYNRSGYLPVRVRAARVYATIDATAPLYVYAVRRDPAPGAATDPLVEPPESFESDAYLVDANGRVVAALLGARVQRFVAAARDPSPAAWLYKLDWEELPPATPPAIPPATATGPWLVFSDPAAPSRASVGAALVERIEARGGACVVVTPGDAFKLAVHERDGGRATTRVEIDPRCAEHYQRLLAVVGANPSGALEGVAHLWSLALPNTPQGADAWGEAERRGVGSATHLLQQLARRGLASRGGVTLVTRAAQFVLGDASAGVLAAPVVGLARVAALELAELRVRSIDLADNPAGDAPSVDRQATQLLAELSAADGAEPQVALRGGLRLAPRLTKDTPTADRLREASGDSLRVPHGAPFQLRLGRGNSIAALRYAPTAAPAVGPGEVALEVHAAGLNFSDVLKALGLYPGVRDTVVPLGIEASGVVTAVGAGVSEFSRGDEVVGVVPYAFASHAVTPAYMLAAKPAGLAHAQAAALPIAYMTAHHVLVRLAGLSPGETVLVHAGAGGVGLAAIEVARRCGATVLATAGSDSKRAYLRELGVACVMDSRSLEFARQARDFTGGVGVDVVLNSLPGDAITVSLAALAPYGRFCEIGKIDIYQDRKLGLAPFQDNLSYHAIDLDRVLRQRPDYVRALWAEVLGHVASGAYAPLPITEFPLSATAQAFRYMAQRQNTGKVVVAVRESAPQATTERAAPEAWLVTGGLGALGRRLAGWLVERGAKGVVLVSRRAPDAALSNELRDLEARGARVATVAADVTDATSLAAGLAALPSDFPRITGVVHAAGVLDDGLLTDLSPERLRRVLDPKTVGAWNLHTLTQDRSGPLAGVERFVLFSSVAATLGSPGQANYAAANHALDALAHHRRSLGLAALTINWGPWAGGGMAAGATADAVRAKGISPLDPTAALALLGDLLDRPDETPAQVAVFDAQWDAMGRLMGGRRPPLLGRVLGEGGETAPASRVDAELRARVLALPPDERAAALESFVRDELARVIGVEPQKLDPTQPLAALGLDSLMALELKNNLEAKLAFLLPMATLLEGPSVQTLAAAAAAAIGDDPLGSRDGEPTPADWSPLVTIRPAKSDADGLAAVYFFPPLGGDVTCYLPLAQRIDSPRGFVALRSRGLDGDAPPHESIDGLVSDYTAAIRGRQPRGPYHLAGWSTGGVTAVAVAERLERDGNRVATLALFDPPTPDAYTAVDLTDHAGFLAEIVAFAGKFSGLALEIPADRLAALPEDERFGFALAHVKRAGFFGPDIDEAYVRRLVAVGEGLVRASGEYKPAGLRARAEFFVPSVLGALERQGVPGHDRHDEAWRALCGLDARVHHVPGDHFTMMTGEGAAAIAAVLDGVGSLGE